jgi:hypothetical protein
MWKERKNTFAADPVEFLDARRVAAILGPKRQAVCSRLLWTAAPPRQLELNASCATTLTPHVNKTSPSFDFGLTSIPLKQFICLHTLSAKLQQQHGEHRSPCGAIVAQVSAPATKLATTPSDVASFCDVHEQSKLTRTSSQFETILLPSSIPGLSVVASCGAKEGVSCDIASAT